MAVPFYQVLIDFDQDGSFDHAQSDVTGRVESLKWSRGKNILKHRAEAAVLDMVLDNNDHLFSPSLSTSPLYPGNLPAPDVRVFLAYPYDSFTDANGTALTNHTPNRADGLTWTVGGAGTFDIQSNRARKSTTSNGRAVLDFGIADAGCRVNAGIDHDLVLRYQDATNFLYVNAYNRIVGGTNVAVIEFGEWVAGVETALRTQRARDRNGAAHAAFTGNERVQLGAYCHGNIVEVYFNDVYQFSYETSRYNSNTQFGFGEVGASGPTWDDFGGWVPVFNGRIDTIEPLADPKASKCYIRAFDDFERANRHVVYRAAPPASAEANDILNVILDTLDTSTTTKLQRVLDTGSTLSVQRDHEKALGRDALTELYQVQDDDVGFVYVDGWGTYRYEDSEHRHRGPHLSRRATWRHDRQNNNQTDRFISKDDFHWDDGKERVENEGYFKYAKVSRSSVAEAWRLHFDDRPSLQPGETRSFVAVGEGDVVSEIIEPVATTDYRVNTAKAGTGSDLTASVAATVTSGFDGNYRLVNLTNNSLSLGYVTFLRLRGRKVTVSNETMARAEDAQSQRDVGRRRIQHDTLFIDEFSTAQDRVERRIHERARPRTHVKCIMTNATRNNLMEILHRRISDRVGLTHTGMGIAHDFYIEHQSVVLAEAGTYIECTWDLVEAFGGGWGNTGLNWGQYAWGFGDTWQGHSPLVWGAKKWG